MRPRQRDRTATFKAQMKIEATRVGRTPFAPCPMPETRLYATVPGMINGIMQDHTHGHAPRADSEQDRELPAKSLATGPDYGQNMN
jgi:hypothetical protein